MAGAFLPSFLPGVGAAVAASLAVTGAATVGTTLDVTGLSTLGSLTVSGATTLVGATALNGDCSVEAGNFLRWFNAGGVEAVKGRWNSNIFALVMEKGAGTQREVRLQSDGGYYIGVEDTYINCGGKVRNSADNNPLLLAGRISNSTAQIGIQVSNDGVGGSIFTASSGTQLFTRWSSDVNQSNTAGYTIMRVFAGEVSCGSGAKAIFLADVNSETKFAVMSASASGAHAAGVGGNIGINTTSAFGGGAGVIGINNATTVPGSNPAAGGVLYAEGGALKWRSAGGLVTEIAPNA